ncbi:ependymin-like [Brachionichthys hirsutus]|uniref:ependymin-like n=1 Tax=Brachionichthys hirsutus TaxID=412623 RepID=UPI003604950B
MRLLVVLGCLLAGCLAQGPQPCTSPPLLTGKLSVLTQNEKLSAYAKYLYDALGERMRFYEIGTYDNKSFTYDALLLYKQAVMYEIHDHNKTCKKLPLKGEFHPMKVPDDASLLGQVVLGSSSGPGQGVLVNTWAGELPESGGKYMATVTEFGCIPVSSFVHTEKFGWVVSSLFDNTIGITDPDLLNPPSFCLDKVSESDGEAVDFLSLFQKMR